MVSMSIIKKYGHRPRQSPDVEIERIFGSYPTVIMGLVFEPKTAIWIKPFYCRIQHNNWDFLIAVCRRPDNGNKKSAFKQLHLFDADNKAEPEWVEVDTASVRVENQLNFGGPWLALQLIHKLKLDELLETVMPPGREDIPWSKIALVLAICRLCNPSSELHIAEHYYKSTAMPELLGIPAAKIYDERLYRALDKLLPHKKAMETHLKDWLGRMFNLKYDLLLYDVTSTYFEGQALGNPMAQRGYSRDKRSDCKQVCIGLVVSKCGMPLGYEVFEGNKNDVNPSSTLVIIFHDFQKYFVGVIAGIGQ